MGNMRTSGFPKTQTEFFNFSSLYNSSLLRMCFSCFSAKANQPARVDRGPLERVGLRGDSFSIVLHLQHLPLQCAHPVPPCTPNSTQRKPPIGSSPEPRGPASGHLFPACSRAAASRAYGDPESLPRSCVGLQGDAPAAPAPAAARPPRRAGDASPRAAGAVAAVSGVDRPRHFRQPGRAGSGGQRPSFDRLRGRTGSESWAIPRDCAARSGGQVGARGGGTGPVPRPAQPGAVRGPTSARLRSHSGPRRRSWALGKAPCRAHSVLEARSLSRGDLLCSDLSPGQGLASNFLSSWRKSLLTPGVWPPP